MWTLRTHAQWGLIAKGPAAAGYAAALLRHAEASAREDGAAILGALVGDDAAVDVLVGALQVERDLEARDAIVAALGRLRNRRALPALAALVEDEDGDGDTRWTAVESLGHIARRRFSGRRILWRLRVRGCGGRGRSRRRSAGYVERWASRWSGRRADVHG